MSQVNNYPSTSGFNSDDSVLITGATSGLRRMPVSKFQDNVSVKAADLLAIMETCPPAISHRMIYRGKNLGTSFTTEQSQAVQNGTFTDMYVGDYWVINGKTRRIGDIDYFIHCGEGNVDLGHHLLIVDDGIDLTADGSTTHFMNDTDTTDGGFKGSKMWQSTIPNKILPDITTAFGSHLLTHRECISNAVTEGVPSGGEWVDTTYNIFNEAMYYGSVVNGANSGGGLYNIGCSKNQIALFKFDQSSMNRRNNIWLRDVVSASGFADVYYGGSASRDLASDPWHSVLGYYLIH